MKLRDVRTIIFVSQELLSSLSEVCSTVETNLSNLTLRQQQTEISLQETSRLTDNVEDLASKAEDLTGKLEDFEDKYF